MIAAHESSLFLITTVILDTMAFQGTNLFWGPKGILRKRIANEQFIV